MRTRSKSYLLRMSEGEKERWEREASARCMALADLIRTGVEQYLNHEVGPTFAPNCPFRNDHLEGKRCPYCAGERYGF